MLSFRAMMGAAKKPLPIPETILSFSHPDLTFAFTMNSADISGSIIDDRSPNNHDAQYIGASQVEGLRGEAMRTDNSDQYIRVPKGFDRVQGAISVWYKMDNVNDVIYISSSRGDSGGSTRHAFAVNGTLNQYTISEWQTSGYTHATYEPDLEWHHIVFNWDPMGRSIWVDGVLLSSTNDGKVFNYAAVADETFISAVPWDALGSGTIEAAGTLEQYRLFNRPVTPTEILELYDELSPVHGGKVWLSHPNIIAAYRFDTLDAATAVDSTPNAYDGGVNGPTALTFSKTSNVYEFDGTPMGENAYDAGVNIPPAVVRTRDAFTVSVWVKGSGTILQTDYYDYDSGGYSTGWSLSTEYVHKATSSTTTKKVSIPNHNPNVWTHLVYCVDQMGDVIVYRNSVEVALGDISGAQYYNGQFYANTGTNIGAGYGLVDSYSGWLDSFDGLMDNVEIFDSILTLDEVVILADPNPLFEGYLINVQVRNSQTNTTYIGAEDIQNVDANRWFDSWAGTQHIAVRKFEHLSASESLTHSGVVDWFDPNREYLLENEERNWSGDSAASTIDFVNAQGDVVFWIKTFEFGTYGSNMTYGTSQDYTGGTNPGHVRSHPQVIGTFSFDVDTSTVNFTHTEVDPGAYNHGQVNSWSLSGIDVASITQIRLISCSIKSTYDSAQSFVRLKLLPDALPTVAADPEYTQGLLISLASGNGATWSSGTDSEYNVLHTNNLYWDDNWAQTSEIAVHEYSYGSQTYEINKTGTVSWFDSTVRMHFYAAEGNWTSDRAEILFAFVNANDDAVFWVKQESYASFAGIMKYGTSLDFTGATTAPWSGGSYPRSDGFFDFNVGNGTIYYTRNPNSTSASLTDSFQVAGLDVGSIVGIKVISSRVISTHTSGGALVYLRAEGVSPLL